ncbi:putative methyltransferase-domain-containing protein [Podospora aff. communis PSN243]|uniref:Methyltransferase-domain-containing protein n=1 Tax=Podospora aff. communis PSN243 TaxID=3040156 RepID=A0AAV9GX67_9PEZI|nr:putative methyltransferase-domain-containing protein [Podospora aff. communis PSN243]
MTCKSQSCHTLETLILVSGVILRIRVKMRGGSPERLSSTADELPHLWQKPTTLINCLRALRVEPPVWGIKTSREEILQAQEQQQANTPREIITFLSSIIKSSLNWIPDDDEKEQIWEEASRRLAERCGRTALGEITRRWPFQDPSYPPFTLSIREPPMNGDSLGLKTWGSSYILSQLLQTFTVPSSPLSHLLSAPNPPPILELGSGTGLLGLAASYIWRTPVTLTDLPSILPNLSHNAQLNASTLAPRGGTATAASLTWGSTSADEVDPRFIKGETYELIIVADPLYDDNHPTLLASTIHTQLAVTSTARVLLMVPLRDGITKRLLGELKTELSTRSVPLVSMQERMVSGRDGDWRDDGDDDETKKVEFWWGVFRRDGGVLDG